MCHNNESENFTCGVMNGLILCYYLADVSALSVK